jgi:exopolysaccharide biosynthesis polyprenyl glycosylphosphotransferase
MAPTTQEVRDIGAAVLIAVLPLLPLRRLLDLQALSAGGVELFGLVVFVGLVVERAGLRLIAAALRRTGRNLRNVVVIGTHDDNADLQGLLAHRTGLGYSVVASFDTTAAVGEADRVMAELEAQLKNEPVDEVFVVASPMGADELVSRVVSACEQEGVTVRLFSRLPELAWAWASVDTLLGQPVITVSSTRPETAMWALMAKRVIDVVGAAVALVVLAPVFAVVALAVRFDSAGPVVFAQDRIGRNRRRFRVFKFRTMVAGADAMQASVEHLNEAEGPVFKIENDPRVTRVGRVLRRTSLDELPQLWNVLRGDMSLVGPRPLPVRDFERIETRWHRRRFSVKPGLTCLWQVQSREPKFDEWIAMDMEYIDNWSLALDLKILAKTIPAVLSRHGAH